MAHLGRRLKVRVRSLTKVNSRHPHLQAPTIWNHSDSTLAIRIETGRCVKIRIFGTPPCFLSLPPNILLKSTKPAKLAKCQQNQYIQNILPKRMYHNTITVPYAQTNTKGRWPSPWVPHLSVACMLLSVGIVREPPLGHTVALLENLFYSPERGESQYPEERLGENRLHEQRTHESRKPEHQKPPPASCAEIIITFDYYGVEKSDDKESRDTEKKSSKIHKK